MAWRKEVNLDEWIRQYSIRRYKEQSPELTRVWEILLPRVYHNKAHLGLQPPTALEPHYSRQMTVSNMTDIAAAYHVIYEVLLYYYYTYYLLLFSMPLIMMIFLNLFNTTSLIFLVNTSKTHSLKFSEYSVPI